MTRNDLYTAVWSNPVRHVAKRIGISDRGLIDICRQAEIPTPPRGFWRKVQTGQMPEKPQLPRPDDDSNVPITISHGSANGAPTSQTHAEKPLTESLALTPRTTTETRHIASNDWLELTPGENSATSSVKNEYQKLQSLSSAFRQHQLVSEFLEHLEESECKESLRTATIIRKWVLTMRRHQAKANPVEKALADFRAMSFSRQKPIWWDVC
jgi:hypothetical protein